MKQTFLNLENNWMNAWKNKDEAGCRKIIAEDFKLTSSLTTGELVDKEDWMNKALGNYNCNDFSIDILDIRSYDQLAIVSFKLKFNGTANGKDWSGHFLITDVWKQNADWQVVSRHSTWLEKNK